MPDQRSNDQLQLDRIEQTVNRLDVYIRGSDDSPEKGLMTRVDRLEQKELSRARWIGAAITAGATSAVLALWNLLTGSGTQ